MSKFSEKLNVRENKEPYQMEEEINLAGGKFEGFLQHDNVIEDTVTIYTEKNQQGEKIESFVLSIDENYPWRTHLRVNSSNTKLYVNYETAGDVIEADDINDIQRAILSLEEAVAGADTSNFVTKDEFNNLKQLSLDAKTAHIQAIESKTGQSSGLTTSSSWQDILVFWNNVTGSGGSSSGGTNLAALFFKMFTFEKNFWNNGFQPSKLTVPELSTRLKNVRLKEIAIGSGIEPFHLSTNAKMILLIFKQSNGDTSSQGVYFDKLEAVGGKKFQIARLAISDYAVDFNKPNKMRLITEPMNEAGEFDRIITSVSPKQFLYFFPEVEEAITFEGRVSWTKQNGTLMIFETDGFK